MNIFFEYQQNDKFGFVWEREILPTFDDNFNGESDSTIKQCLGVAFFSSRTNIMGIKLYSRY